MYRNIYCALMSSAVETDFTGVKTYIQITMKEMRNSSEDVCIVCNTGYDGPSSRKRNTQANGFEGNIHEIIIRADGLQ